MNFSLIDPVTKVMTSMQTKLFPTILTFPSLVFRRERKMDAPHSIKKSKAVFPRTKLSINKSAEVISWTHWTLAQSLTSLLMPSR